MKKVRKAKHNVSQWGETFSPYFTALPIIKIAARGMAIRGLLQDAGPPRPSQPTMPPTVAPITPQLSDCRGSFASVLIHAVTETPLKSTKIPTNLVHDQL